MQLVISGPNDESSSVWAPWLIQEAEAARETITYTLRMCFPQIKSFLPPTKPEAKPLCLSLLLHLSVLESTAVYQ